MKRTITSALPDSTRPRGSVSRRLGIRLLWFFGIWGASVAVMGFIAYLLHEIILG